MTRNTVQTDEFASVLQEAAETASNRWGGGRYNTFHLLIAIMRKDVVLREWLELHGMRFNDLMSHAAEAHSERESQCGDILAMVHRMAMTQNVPKHPVHLLYALLNFPETWAGRLLSERFPVRSLIQEITRNKWHSAPPTASEEVAKTDKPFGGLGTDLTKMAAEGKLRPVFGRDDEIRQVIEILAQKDPGQFDEAINNPVLLGPAGVGKSAIAKGLALLISRRDPIARLFFGHRVVYVDFGGLQSGTGIRGSLESRIKSILKECEEGPLTILFLDELHVIMGLGKTEGSSGFEETMKPVLAGGLSCIGATTTDEWHIKIERVNPAFARRFIPVPVEEPDAAQTLRILNESVDDLARRHLVYFPPEVLVQAVKMGRQYLPYQASPAREIELILNGVGGKLKVAGRFVAEANDVAAKISELVKFPVTIEDTDRSRFLDAFDILSRTIIGQPRANRVLADGVIRYASGMRETNRPLVVLALGPTGVGKTHSAQTLADAYWNGRLSRLDLSEYMERHSVSRLIGAPPGYVGYEGEGCLTKSIRDLVMGVMLLDEVEKAHPDVWQIFLQLFDAGRLTDSHGKTVDASNFVFVMTSNLGARHFFPARNNGMGFAAQDSDQVSFEEIRERVMADVRGHFSPEFLNRIDEVVIYDPLTRESVHTIAIGLLERERTRCSMMDRGFSLSWSDEIVEYLVRKGYSFAAGARPMKRVVTREIQTLLARPILSGEISLGDRVELFSDSGAAISWRKLV